MSDLLGRICFSNAAIEPAFRCVKRVFFHRWVLWPVGVMLALGLVLIRVFAGNEGLLVVGLLLSSPFIVWVALLALISVVVSIALVPRIVALGLAGAAFYLGVHGMVERLARWAAKHDDSRGKLPLSKSVSPRSSDESRMEFHKSS
jgi:hypothetical protein